MRVLDKCGDKVTILALPEEDVKRGDYLLVGEEGKRQLLVQVCDESYLDTLGTKEDLVRKEVILSKFQGVDNDPIQLGSLSSLLSDMRVLVCKIRGGIEDGYFTPNVAWLPSRVTSEINKVSISNLMNFILPSSYHKVTFGHDLNGEAFDLAIESFDGALNIILGRKGSGKSHLAKLLASKLVEFGAYVFIIDLNGEYGGLAWKLDGSPSHLSDKLLILEPGRSLRFTLDYLGKRAVTGLLTKVLDLPGASLREFHRIWDALVERGSLSLKSIGDAIGSWKCNELIRDALYSRYYSLLSSRLFTDREEEAFKVEEVFSYLKDGGAIIILLKGSPPLIWRMVIELFLSKLVELLERESIPPCFLFAEEAHLYLRDTYWEDVVTRMRHLGVFTTFITNQPESIKPCVYRQADNIFLFSFSNDSDLESVSRVCPTDTDTVRSIVRFLPKGTCLALGELSKGLPIVLKVAPLDTIPLGETKTYFRAQLNEAESYRGVSQALVLSKVNSSNEV